MQMLPFLCPKDKCVAFKGQYHYLPYHQSLSPLLVNVACDNFLCWHIVFEPTINASSVHLLLSPQSTGHQTSNRLCRWELARFLSSSSSSVWCISTSNPDRHRSNSRPWYTHKLAQCRLCRLGHNPVLVNGTSKIVSLGKFGPDLSAFSEPHFVLVHSGPIVLGFQKQVFSSLGSLGFEHSPLIHTPIQHVRVRIMSLRNAHCIVFMNVLGN